MSCLILFVSYCCGHRLQICAIFEHTRSVEFLYEAYTIKKQPSYELFFDFVCVLSLRAQITNVRYRWAYQSDWDVGVDISAPSGFKKSHFFYNYIRD